MRKFSAAFMLTAALVGTAALAGDASFTPDAAATWSARSLLMANVINFEPGELKGKFKLACSDLTGEQMKHEYGKEPRWALSSQLNICSGYNGWAGKFIGSKQPCKELEKGIKDLANATPLTAPPQVVAAAQALSTTARKLVDVAKEAKRCKL